MDATEHDNYLHLALKNEPICITLGLAEIYMFWSALQEHWDGEKMPRHMPLITLANGRDIEIDSRQATEFYYLMRPLFDYNFALTIQDRHRVGPPRRCRYLGEA